MRRTPIQLAESRTLSDITWQYARGGFAEIYKLPTRRDLLTNDRAEHDGLEVDLSEPVWEPHKLSVEIHVPPPKAYRFQASAQSEYR